MAAGSSGQTISPYRILEKLGLLFATKTLPEESTATPSGAITRLVMVFDVI